MATWCERWHIKINEDKTQAIYFSHRHRLPDSLLTLNGRNIQFVNHVKYLGVIFDKKMTLRLHTEMIEAKAFRKFIRIYSLFKSERLSANIKLTLHKALIRSVMTYLKMESLCLSETCCLHQHWFRLSRESNFLGWALLYVAGHVSSKIILSSWRWYHNVYPKHALYTGINLALVERATFWAELSSTSLETCHRKLFFRPEDGITMFIRNMFFTPALI
jgi:hypothetical protein